MSDLFRIELNEPLEAQAALGPSREAAAGRFPRKTETATLLLLDRGLREALSSEVEDEMLEHGLGYSEIKQLELTLPEREPDDYEVSISYFIYPGTGKCSPGRWESFSFQLPRPMECNKLIPVTLHSLVIVED